MRSKSRLFNLLSREIELKRSAENNDSHCRVIDWPIKSLIWKKMISRRRRKRETGNELDLKNDKMARIL